MIRNLTGIISYQGENYLIIDISGVGYMVFTPSTTFSAVVLGESLSLWTHLSVRETSMDLYGFLTKEDLDFFEMLINVSGVGPKSALSILNLAPVEHLIAAIVAGNNAYLTKVSGIGKRSAAKIIVELRDSLEKIVGDASSSLLKEEVDALLALQALGYSTVDARSALREVGDTAVKTNEKIKEALKYLGKS